MKLASGDAEVQLVQLGDDGMVHDNGVQLGGCWEIRHLGIGGNILVVMLESFISGLMA